MKILTVVGARPQFIKAAVLSAELASLDWCREILVNTGQHYDYEMAGVFFYQLGIRKPDYSLGVGSGTHAVQTAEMMRRLEPIVDSERPDCVLVYGDTNSTLAGALVAAKLAVPVAHVEAGLRCFNRDMPEEINRVIVDHVSSILFAPNQRAAAQLADEGITEGTEVVGDLMIDLVRRTAKSLPLRPRILDRFGLASGTYAVTTIHRAANADDRAVFGDIIAGLRRIKMPVIFPAHPRVTAVARDFNVGNASDNIILCEPLPYVDMIALQQNARVILTDSGGMQKEALSLGVPCVTLRAETEWTETLANGWNVLAGHDPEAIATSALRPAPKDPRPEFCAEGNCAVRIAAALRRRLPVRAVRVGEQRLPGTSAMRKASAAGT